MLDPSTKYAGRITAPDANYLYGSSKNETAPGADDGTPYEIARANDIFGMQQALLRECGIVPTNNSDTQLASQALQAIVEIAAGRAVNYTGGGTANAHTLTLKTGHQGADDYFDGMISEFFPSNNNTGATTANVDGHGVKNVFYKGAACAGGELLTTRKAIIEYDLANDRHNLIIKEDVIIASATGFTRIGNTFIADDGVHATTFDVDAVIGTPFESVGPTGSGATNIWTAMDNIPANAKGVIVRFWSELLGATNADLYSTLTYARKTGSSIVVADNTRVSAAGFYNRSGSTQTDRQVTEVFIPVDSNLRFDLSYGEAGTSVTANVVASLVGFKVGE